jgi:hypothetical protein
VEPFAGSAGYSLRYPSHNVVLVERDPLIAATWRYLLRVSAAEILALPDIRMDQTVADMPWCEECNIAPMPPSSCPDGICRVGRPPTPKWKGWCCRQFRKATTSNCPDHPDPDAECADVFIIKISRGYGLPVPRRR